MAQEAGMSLRFPAFTLILAGAVLVIHAVPALKNLLVYDRQAILLGEWWRIVTAPLVHFSFSHLVWNLLVFGAAGWVVESARYRNLWLVCTIPAVIPGLVYIFTAPQLAVYGGLSGIATGTVAYLSFCELGKKGKGGSVWLVILLLVGLKILVEAVGNEAIFVQTGTLRVRVLPLVHLTGVLGALVVRFWWETTDTPHISNGPMKGLQKSNSKSEDAPSMVFPPWKG